MHRILWGFETQIDQLLPPILSDLMFINKKKIRTYLLDFTVLAHHRVKLKELNDRPYVDLA